MVRVGFLGYTGKDNSFQLKSGSALHFIPYGVIFSSVYSEELLIKSKLAKPDLDSVFLELKKTVKFVNPVEYSSQLGNALKLGEKLSKRESEEFADDIDFFALSLKENAPIWSNDALFKKIRSIKVFNTKDLVKHLKSTEDKF